MGPITLFDKSALESLSVDESVWLDAFYSPIITPLFFVETLADLEKEVEKGRTPEKVVGNLAKKTPVGANTNVHHVTLSLGELRGAEVEMRRVPIIPGGEPVVSGGRKGVVVKQPPEIAALHRWDVGQFLEVEREFARAWRKALSGLNLDIVYREGKAIISHLGRPKDLAEAKALAVSVLDKQGSRYTREALRALRVAEGLRDEIVNRWRSAGEPSIMRFAPFTAHMLTVDAFFSIALGADLISRERPSNKIDVAYLYYLPFCMVFTSNDNLHARTAPLFMGDGQLFLRGTALKADLGKLDKHYSGFPSEIKERGVMVFAHYPPIEGNFLTSQLWDKLMNPKWREHAKDPGFKVSEHEERRLIAEINRMADAPRSDVEFSSEEAESVIIERMSPVRKGKWRLLPPEVEKQSPDVGRDPARPPRTMSLSERNIVLLNAMADILGLKKGKKWDEIRRELSDDQVRHIYKVVGSLWPPDTDIGQVLPRPTTELRALYLGVSRPEIILKNVVRYSLYADEILVVNPFPNPWTIAREYNPIIHPSMHKTSTLQIALLLGLLEPWLRSGLVQLIPDPGDFDYQLRKKTWEMALDRHKGWQPKDEDMGEMETIMEAESKRILLRAPKSYKERIIRKAVPGISDKQLAAALDALERIRKEDPLILDQPVEKVGNELLMFSTGANLEMGMFIAQATGAFPYTNIPHRWREILSAATESAGESNVWAPLTHAFQQLEFKFLDEVDPTFAHTLREEGRLGSFRSFLRRIWGTAVSDSDPSKISSATRGFTDQLHDEFNKAQAEWSKIDKDLLKWASGTIVGALTSGHFNLELPTLGFCIAGVIELLQSHLRRAEFRKTVPMAVFLDLARRHG